MTDVLFGLAASPLGGEPRHGVFEVRLGHRRPDVGGGHVDPPVPVASGTWVLYPKEELIEILDALADAEALLARLGEPAQAARAAALFDLVEGRLFHRLRAQPASSAGSNARASEFTQ